MDIDENDSHTMNLIYQESKDLPEFIEFDGEELLEIKPTLNRQSGLYVLKITVEDDNANRCVCGTQSDTIFLVIQVNDQDFFNIFGFKVIEKGTEKPNFFIKEITD